jgi:type IV pilus assembly protein PilB
MHLESDKLKEFILDSRLVSGPDYTVCEKEAEGKKQKVGEVLISRGYISEDDLRKIEANILGIPFVSLKLQKIDFDVLSLIPEPIARNYNIVAYKKSDKSLEVAMLDTDNLPAIDFIKKKTGLKILPRLTDTESIKDVLLQYQKSLKAEFGDIIKTEAESITPLSEEESSKLSEEELKKIAEDLPVVRIVDTLIKHAVLQDASDIHIEPGEKDVIVRYRIDGILHDAMVLPRSSGASITARIKVLSSLRLDEKRLPQDGRFKIEIEGEKISFRVSILPVHYGEKTVMRLLREGGGGFTLESLGFHGENLERIHTATKQSTGMILATGPTGSGKTTTLYTVLDILNTPDVNISTIEDPIEYQMARVNQTQVKPEIGLTFGSGLRSLVRQDPDIIMVGEIRDKETAGLAINAALTGHLVLSTLHTNSAAGTLPRLIDMGAESFLIVSTIKVIIGQRLVRQLTKEREKYFLKKAELEHLGQSIDLERMLSILKEEGIIEKKATWEKVPFYKPKKSADAEDGYAGRVGIHEVLKMSSSLKDLIMKGATSDEIEVQAKKEGMLTMLEDGIFKAVQGRTSLEEVFRAISE